MENKKKVILGGFFLFLIIGLALFFYKNQFFIKKEENSEKISGRYYKDFIKKCSESKDRNCCLSSIKKARTENSLIYENERIEDVKCPKGTVPNMDKCIGSYKWCTKEK